MLVIDFRLYRAALLPALVALVIALFSFQTIPDPLEPQLSLAGFDQGRALATARQVVEAGPTRAPGSDGDRVAADLVAQRFSDLASSTLSEQRFEDGDSELRNVILTLPGESDRTVVVMAARDSGSGPGAASSAAATGALVELATVLSSSDHTKTIVVVSTDAGSDGALGAREFADAYENLEAVDAVVVLSQPGAAALRQPYLVQSSTGEGSTAIQLVRTAEQQIAAQVGEGPRLPGLFAGLARLALPSGLGEQAVLIDEGIDAVAISSAGESPLPVSRDELGDLSGPHLAEFGRAALATVLALDAAPAPPEHGPDAYVELSGNLVPGWALSVLALALLLPAAVAALDGIARAARHHLAIGRAIAWAGSLSLPFLLALTMLYLGALVGIVPRPRFPFDPGRFETGFGEALAIAALAAVVVVAFVRLHLARAPSGVAPGALVAAVGGYSAAALVLVWAINPLLALLLAPAAHVWLLQARPRGPVAVPLALAAVAASLLPLAAAVAEVGGAIGLGDAPLWRLLLMVADGQIGALTMIALCVLAGSLAGAVAARGAAVERGPSAASG